MMEKNGKKNSENWLGELKGLKDFGSQGYFWIFINKFDKILTTHKLG